MKTLPQGFYLCCSGCGFKRPEPDYTASDICSQNSAWAFCLDHIYIHSPAHAPYNIYNTLAVYGVLRAMDIPVPHFQEMIEAFDYGNNRENCFQIGYTRVQLHLAKNPVGFQQKIALLLKDPAPKDLLIQINDAWQDGRDVSWLWDVNFHYLAKAAAQADVLSYAQTMRAAPASPAAKSIASVTVCGSRCHDMALRLKYEDIRSSLRPIYGKRSKAWLPAEPEIYM